MEKTHVRVPWQHGLHLQPAGRIARVAQRFHATIRLRLGNRVSEATSVLGLVILCATLNASVLIEADGTDENEALQAIAACFEPDGDDADRG